MNNTTTRLFLATAARDALEAFNDHPLLSFEQHRHLLASLAILNGLLEESGLQALEEERAAYYA